MNIQFKGYLVYLGYSERMYELFGSNFVICCPMDDTINNAIFLTNMFLFNMQCAKIHECVHNI